MVPDLLWIGWDGALYWVCTLYWGGGGIPLLHKEPRSLHCSLIIDINMVKVDSSQSSDFKTYVQN